MKVDGRWAFQLMRSDEERIEGFATLLGIPIGKTHGLLVRLGIIALWNSCSEYTIQFKDDEGNLHDLPDKEINEAINHVKAMGLDAIPLLAEIMEGRE